MKKITVIFTLLLSFTCFSQSFWIKYAVEVDSFSNTEFDNTSLNDSNTVDGLINFYNDIKSIEFLDCGKLIEGLGLVNDFSPSGNGCKSLTSFTDMTFEGDINSELIGSSTNLNGFFEKLIIKPYSESDEISHIMKYTSGQKDIPEEWAISFFGLQIR